jgi:hypothetical protein
VDCFAFGPQSLRLVTHLDITSEAIDQAAEALRRVAELSPASEPMQAS